LGLIISPNSKVNKHIGEITNGSFIITAHDSTLGK